MFDVADIIFNQTLWSFNLQSTQNAGALFTKKAFDVTSFKRRRENNTIDAPETIV